MCLDGNDQIHVIKLAGLEALLQRGKSLDVAAVEEEKYFECLLHELSSTALRIQTLFCHLYVSPLLVTNSIDWNGSGHQHLFRYGVGHDGVFRTHNGTNNALGYRHGGNGLYHPPEVSSAGGLLECTVGHGSIRGLFPSKYSSPYSMAQLEYLLSTALSHKLGKLPVNHASVLVYALASPEYYTTLFFQELRLTAPSNLDDKLDFDVGAQMKCLQQQKLQIDSLLTNFPFTTSGSNQKQKKVTLDELQDLLHDSFLNNQAIQMNELLYFQEVHATSTRFFSLINDILGYFTAPTHHLYGIPNNNKKEKVGHLPPLLGVPRVLQWEAVLQIMESLQQYPVFLPNISPLLKYLQQVVLWRKEVIGLVYTGGNDESNENVPKRRGSGMGRGSGTQKDKGSADKKVSVQRIEALLKEGESFPFPFSVEINILKEKKAVALEWLEKLTRTFSQPKRSRAKQPGDELSGNNTNATKMTYEEMKQMVEDGKSLYLQTNTGGNEDGNEANQEVKADGTNVASTMAANIKGMRNVNRDLNRASAALQAAENWMTRVHDTIKRHYRFERKHSMGLLAFIGTISCGSSMPLDDLQTVDDEEDYDSESDDANSLDEMEDTQGVRSIDNDKEKYKQEKKLLKHRKALIDMLSSLLSEASNLAIALEESDELKFIVQSLEWAIKRRKTLFSLIMNDRFRPIDQAENVVDEADEATASVITPNSTARSTVNEILQMKQEISKIRGNSSYNPLPEESLCLYIFDTVDKFLLKVKKTTGAQVSHKMLFFFTRIIMHVN